MHVRFTNTDSTGSPVTSLLTVTLDGERHEIAVAGTGTARVPEHVGEHLIESPNYAVESAGAETDAREIERAAAAVVSDIDDSGNEADD